MIGSVLQYTYCWCQFHCQSVHCWIPQAYNPEESIFGVVRLTFTWEDSGSISTNIEVAGLPAAQYQVGMDIQVFQCLSAES
jgi:hypothetical protein